MPAYDGSLIIADARVTYFRNSGFAADGGYGDKWVVLRAGRFPVLAFPNVPSRVRSVKLHDIHHILTEYDTNWTGEAEIGAWELASGCGRYLPAWVLNAGAVIIGLFIAPRRVVTAWARGKRSRNLYEGVFTDELLTRTVRELRAELAIPPLSQR